VIFITLNLNTLINLKFLIHHFIQHRLIFNFWDQIEQFGTGMFLLNFMSGFSWFRK